MAESEGDERMKCYHCDKREANISLMIPPTGDKTMTYVFYFCKTCAIEQGILNKKAFMAMKEKKMEVKQC